MFLEIWNFLAVSIEKQVNLADFLTFGDALVFEEITRRGFNSRNGGNFR